MGEVVLVVEVVVAVVVAVVRGLSFLRLRTFLLVEVVAEVVVVDFGVVVVVVVVEVESHGLGAGRWMRFHQGLREVGSGLAVVLMTMLEGVAVVVWVAEDLSVVEVRLFHHLRLHNSVLA